jgi:phosphomethylpyrimidine synthase
MKTQIELAREGVVTQQMATVAADEGVTPEYVREKVAQGRIVIPWSRIRNPRVAGIGEGLRTKVNASIGTSSDIIDYDAEVRKGLAAMESGADTLMELSVGGDLDRVRR